MRHKLFGGVFIQLKNRLENQSRVDFSSIQGNVSHITPSGTSRSIILELKIVRNSSGLDFPL